MAEAQCRALNNRWTYVEVYDFEKLSQSNFKNGKPEQVAVPKVFMPGSEQFGKLSETDVLAWLSKASEVTVTAAWVLQSVSADDETCQCSFAPFHDIEALSPFQEGAIILFTCQASPDVAPDTAQRLMDMRHHAWKRKMRCLRKVLAGGELKPRGKSRSRSRDQEPLAAVLEEEEAEPATPLSAVESRDSWQESSSSSAPVLQCSEKPTSILKAAGLTVGRGEATHEDKPDSKSKNVGDMTPRISFDVWDFSSDSPVRPPCGIMPSNASNPGAGLRGGRSATGYIACL